MLRNAGALASSSSRVRFVRLFLFEAVCRVAARIGSGDSRDSIPTGNAEISALPRANVERLLARFNLVPGTAPIDFFD